MRLPPSHIPPPSPRQRIYADSLLFRTNIRGLPGATQKGLDPETRTFSTVTLNL